MSVLKFPNQLKYTGNGYLDPKVNMVVRNLEELNGISVFDRFEGMSVIVIDDGTGIPSEYYVTDENTMEWVKKNDFKLSFDQVRNELQLKNGSGVTGAAISFNEIFGGKIVTDVAVVDENGQKVPGKFLKVTYYPAESVEGGKLLPKTREEYYDIAEVFGSLVDGSTIVKGEDGKLEVKLSEPEKMQVDGADVPVSPHLEKAADGIAVNIPITGDDVGVEMTGDK